MYGIINCGSVKKARMFLEERGIDYEFIDFKKFPPTIELVRNWVEKQGIAKVVNNKGMTYKKLGLKDKNLSQEELLECCVQNPSLIKRPVVQRGDILLLGFDEEIYKENLC
ncbi:Spx/MgsR family RNA polymerase-binding regulatory protein [Helicobacter sp. faydin-H20]|uniref:arsenate reductase family protein n=1 Tax=Helicobacter anatolicus TaxID=2905874 RepID=UPI001E34F15A|nr:Spx/MgsR family RNA polymerase-binding regulatory protein [Helicobacter anatolicus]MCE3036878.1 Spx/MgsR family RNA polymerase-binding regulatory protein [Helicobacter anatolicus]